MKTIHKLKQSTSNFKNHFVRDSKVVVTGTLFMFMLFGVVNVSAVSYKIIYDDNVVSNMPEDVKSTTMNDSENISSDKPTREGYSFLKWCTQVPASDGTCPGAAYDAGVALPIVGTSKNEYSLYAMWEEEVAGVDYCKNSSYDCMQDLTAATCPTTVKQVIDARDGTIYNVQKLADNKCWMLDNLALDLVDSAVQANLNSSTTNASDVALTYLKNGGGTSPYTTTAVVEKTSGWNTNSPNNAYAYPYISTAYIDTTFKKADFYIDITNYGNNNGKIGGYYNYCAATAGTYCYANGSGIGDAAEDICPAGWRMPTGGSSGEYQALYAAYDSNVADFNAAFAVSLSGGFYGDGPYNWDLYGRFWSSTTRNINSMYLLEAYSDETYPTEHGLRREGYPVRCVLK